MQDYRKVVVSGIRATGRLHMGNLLGAIRNFFPLQEDNDCYFFVADYHTLTTLPDPEELRKHRLPIVKTFLATGISPERSAIYYQSAVPEVAELQLLLGMLVSVSELERCTTYKDKISKHSDNVNFGLLGYPVLMAADILLHKGTIVPVGEDQIQHLEMARDFARRFNKKFGKIFPEPRALQHEPIRLPGLDGNKMGKSDNNTIDLLDPPDVVEQKMKKAKTDLNRRLRTDKGNPESCASVFPLHQLVSEEQEVQEIRAGCVNARLSCSDCKLRAAAAVNRMLRPIQDKHHSISDGQALEVLHEGALRARKNARETVSEVRSAMGLT